MASKRLRLGATVMEKFFFYVDVRGDDECWPFTGKAKCGRGYGVIAIPIKNGSPRRNILAHRFAYSYFVRPILPDEEVCHTCDFPSCCNPAHLFAASHYENMQDMVRKGRTGMGKVTHCPKGHPYSGDNLIQRKRGRWCRACKNEWARMAERRKRPEAKEAA